MKTIVSIFYLVLAILSILYSFIIYLINSGTFSFLIWISIGIIFFILFYLSLNNNYKKIPYRLRILLYIITSLILLFFLIIEGFIFSKFYNIPKNDNDYLIVLGAQMREDGPIIAYKYRLDAAYDYLIKNANVICILTGGRGNNEPISEGEGGYNYLINKGIDKNRLLYEDTSTSTYENISNALKLIDNPHNKKIAIVTNRYHLFRGMMIAKKILSKEVDGIPAAVNHLYIINSLVREFFGVVKDIWIIF